MPPFVMGSKAWLITGSKVRERGMLASVACRPAMLRTNSRRG